MSTSRRSFLKKSTVIALAAGIPISLSKEAVAETLIGSSVSSTLTKKDFVACLDSEFIIRNAGNQVKTKLVEVVDLPKPAKTRDREGFSLVFRGDRSLPLKQNTYVIEHERLGKFSFLLVPSNTSDKGANYYVATVNRLFP